jgi:hypothetical protein
MIPASWKSAAAMKKTIKNKEKDNWSVVALGDISGRNMLIFVDDGNNYEHEVIQIFWSLRGKVSDIIAEKQDDDWKVATLGACLGSTLLIMKRRIDDEPEEDLKNGS